MRSKLEPHTQEYKNLMIMLLYFNFLVLMQNMKRLPIVVEESQLKILYIYQVHVYIYIIYII